MYKSQWPEVCLFNLVTQEEVKDLTWRLEGQV
jgi:hypothetical protein